MWWWLAACAPAPSPAGVCTLGPTGEEDGRLVGFTEAHNGWRERVGVGPLEWDPTLGEVAADWLSYLVADRDCALEHDWSSPLGENLAWNSGFESHPCRVVEGWAEERHDYDYETNTCHGEDCGHWTQVVWSTSTRVGCAFDTCPDGSEIWMCDYDPPGNIVGRWPY